MKYSTLLLLGVVILALVSVSHAVKLNYASGVVEGFYWAQSDAVNGRNGSYTPFQRGQLFNLMAQNGLGTYWYVPQLVDLMAMWNSTQLSEWYNTANLANSLGIRLVYGLRPGWLDTDFTPIITRLQQIQSCGIRYYTLNFDDAEGVDTQQQQQREGLLASNLTATVPLMNLWAVTPSAYYQSAFLNKTAWETALGYLDGALVNKSKPFVVTGAEITPSTMTTSNFPTLSSNRPMIFWDNWIAEDTSTRLPWGLTDGRVQQSIYSAPYGYMLNLCFPLERVIHQIYCEGLLANGATTCNVTATAQYWATWLNTNGFLHGNQTVSSVSTALYTAINSDTFYNSIAEMESHNPGLTGIFSTPPSLSTTSSSSTSTPTTSSTSSSSTSTPTSTSTSSTSSTSTTSTTSTSSTSSSSSTSTSTTTSSSSTSSSSDSNMLKPISLWLSVMIVIIMLM